MEREDKIKFIYKYIGEPIYRTKYLCPSCKGDLTEWDDACLKPCDWYKARNHKALTGDERVEKKEISGHKQVVLGDILDWGEGIIAKKVHAKMKNVKEEDRLDTYFIGQLFGDKIHQNLINLYKKKRLPIESQDEQCIEYVVDLIKKNIIQSS